MKTMKLRCAALLTALLTALAVFVGTLGKSELKSQMKKRKAAKQQQELIKSKIVDEEALTRDDINKS